MKRLSKSEIKDLNVTLESFGLVFDRKDILEESDRFIRKDGKAVLFFHEGRWLPSLHAIASLKSVRIDKGAIPFMLKGADVMRPGITSWDESIKEGDLIAIQDEAHRKSVALGIALMGSEDLAVQKVGKAVKNIHFVGDEIWNA